MNDELPLVLLVDDDPNDQELARIALELSKIPHRLHVVKDGAEALAYLKASGNSQSENGAYPHLTLLDLKLPKVTGLEVLRHLRSDEKTRRIPVVVFTSSVEDKDLDTSYGYGANAYIRKPNDFAEYKATVADMGRFWILRNESPHVEHRDLKTS